VERRELESVIPIEVILNSTSGRIWEARNFLSVIFKAIFKYKLF